MRSEIREQHRLSFIWRLIGIAAFLLLWEVAALIVASDLILPGPWPVAISLLKMSKKSSFWFAVAGSFVRVLEAFSLSIMFGILTGSLSAVLPRVRAALSPIMTGIRATPVLALILLAMFWFPSSQVPVFSAILMAFPIMHSAAESGILATDEKLLEMSHLFMVPRKTVLWHLRIPSAFPYILSGAKNALGISWKVIVAGEILSQPRFALGTGMQEARLSLETPSVFAWALMTIVLCGLSEYLFGKLIRSRRKDIRSPLHRLTARSTL